jgi:glycosyltransferase involved in cell wall biosynthesis
MKVLHVSSEASWRGGEQQIAYLLQESRKKGIHVELLLRKESAFQAWAEKENFPFTSVSFSGLSLIGAALQLKKCAKNVDLIHVHSGKGHDVLAIAYLLGLKTPSILSRRVDFPVKKSLWASWKYNHPRITRVLCVSDAIRDMIRPALKNPMLAVTVHSGVDLERYAGIKASGALRKILEIDEDRILIGVLAALAPHKDLFTFISTAALLKAEGMNALFVIMGEGNLRTELEAFVKEKGVQNELQMIGFRTDALQLLPDLNIFLITSKTEGLGTSIIDAMASGVPVIATRAGGIPELVIDGKTGALADVGDARGLADQVKKVLADKSLQQEFTQSAKAHIQDFSYQRTAEKTFIIYEEVLTSLGL